jgi:hypothetical protein
LRYHPDKKKKKRGTTTTREERRGGGRPPDGDDEDFESRRCSTHTVQCFEEPRREVHLLRVGVQGDVRGLVPPDRRRRGGGGTGTSVAA